MTDWASFNIYGIWVHRVIQWSANYQDHWIKRSLDILFLIRLFFLGSRSGDPYFLPWIISNKWSITGDPIFLYGSRSFWSKSNDKWFFAPTSEPKSQRSSWNFQAESVKNKLSLSIIRYRTRKKAQIFEISNLRTGFVYRYWENRVFLLKKRW